MTFKIAKPRVLTDEEKAKKREETIARRNEEYALVKRIADLLRADPNLTVTDHAQLHREKRDELSHILSDGLSITVDGRHYDLPIMLRVNQRI